MIERDELFLKVAKHLAKRDVIIRWQTPEDAHALAQTYKLADGTCLVDIGYISGDLTCFEVMLHELCHARFDYSWMPVYQDTSKIVAKSRYRTPEQRAEWGADAREKRAQEYAKKWLKYAESHAYKYWRVDRTWIQASLYALLDWSEDEKR